MKKMVIMVFMMLTAFLFISQSINATGIEYVRSHYEKAVKDEQLCRSLILSLSDKSGDALYLAYLGAFQTIWANHTVNPLSKLNTFRTGRNNIEKAVKLDSDNVEIRFVRLSVQLNCPAFLGYNTSVDKDRAFIRANMNKVGSAQLKELIKTVLN